ncbi:hypothetical protein MTR67_012372 [Solanum verrucosum]|uniref:Integrase zinc-binding domain-containing protein n=1 Tax=Solanum verrucosum TaxID=315347 RepID=A0AAF0Q8H3_SOLVR|nr:hypothetical protein MTR67_012372 [Solanum verrucosum]
MLEFLKDYDMNVLYHPDKANVVADALNRLSMGSVAHVEEEKKELAKYVHRLAPLGVCLMDTSNGGVIVQNGSESLLIAEVKEKQDRNPILLQLKGAVHQQKVEVFSQEGDGVLCYQGRLCVPNVGELRKLILIEAHNSRYSIHPGATKMYHDLQEVYWWYDMKRAIANFLAKCPNCQQVKVEHQKPGVTKSAHFLVVKTTDSAEDYAKLYINEIVRLHGAPLSIISDRGETTLIGLDSIHEAMKKVQLIKDRLKITQSRQKSYVDVRRRDLKFEIDDWVFLKLLPMKGVVIFGKKGKLIPRYVGPYRIVKKGWLRNKKVASVKVLWRSQSVEGATWEAEAVIMSRYPHLFPSDSVLA